VEASILLFRQALDNVTPTLLQGKKFLVNVAAATSGGPWIFGETAPLGDKYTLGSKLGEGAFGITKKVGVVSIIIKLDQGLGNDTECRARV
jgi:hypothetical protein